MEGYFVLVAFAIGFLVAQIWKTLMGVILDKKSGKTISLSEVVKHFASSGGMPSGHTASFTGASLCVGTIYGFGSGIFALAVCVWAIVVYDATHVRYAVGEQGKALNKLLKKAGDAELPVVNGHTIPQVIVGALLGVVVWMIVMLITKF